MNKGRLFSGIILVVALVLSLSGFSYAQETKKAESSSRKPVYALELLTGFGSAKLHEQGRYRMLPFFLDVDFDLKPHLEMAKINYPGIVQFVLEPFISYVYEPRDNIEAGNNFALKIGLLPDTAKLQPYLKGGLGFLFMSQHTREEGGQFNFDEFIGAGFHYFFRKNVAFTMEYRYRHLSNCATSSPNSGINTNFALCGVSYIF